MRLRLLRGGSTGQSLESLVKDWSLISGCTFQQWGKATASAIKNSRLSFVKMGGRQGFGTEQQRHLLCQQFLHHLCWAEHSVSITLTVRPLQTFCVLIQIPFPLWIPQKLPASSAWEGTSEPRANSAAGCRDLPAPGLANSCVLEDGEGPTVFFESWECSSDHIGYDMVTSYIQRTKGGPRGLNVCVLYSMCRNGGFTLINYISPHVCHSTKERKE